MNLCLMQSFDSLKSEMANVSEWDAILNDKFKVYPVEESIYIDSVHRANGPEMFAKFICDQICPGDVPENLQRLYREAVYGTDAKVKNRIKKRMYLIGCKAW